MTRLQFIILTALSVLVALSLFLNLYLAQASVVDENRLRLTGEALQEGQLDYNRLQQVANWTATLAEQKDDQALRDVLDRNNIQMKPAPAAPAAAPAAPAAPTTH